MKNLLVLFCAFIFMSNSTKSISMYGISIHDDKSVLEKLKLDIVNKEDNMIKYRTENGNDFSITTEDDKIVYMENDWLQKEKGKQTFYPELIFGETSLREIRKHFGTNGFTYKSRMAITTETDLIQFNCYEYDSPDDEVLVVITKVPINTEDITEENVADKLKLDALIISDKNYLDQIWGNEKLFDNNYKKIKP